MGGGGGTRYIHVMHGADHTHTLIMAHVTPPPPPYIIILAWAQNPAVRLRGGGGGGNLMSKSKKALAPHTSKPHTRPIVSRKSIP